MTIASYSAALTQLDENLAWDGNRTKALLFVEAVRYLRVHRPLQNSGGGRSFTYESLKDDFKDAVKFINATDTTNQAKFIMGRAKYEK